MAAFFTKWLGDVRDAQAPDGRFPDFAPHPHDPNQCFSGNPGWGDAGVIVPWRMYVNYADLDLLLRTVRPDGAIWLMDNNPPAEGATHHTAGTDEFGNHYKKRWLDTGEEYRILKNYFGETDLRTILEPAFRIEKLIYGTYYWSVQLCSPHPGVA